ncbi:MAG: TetR/AcrR family transcriptional regulator [Parvularculaceae bacterium]|nr:TetR/AcrR family transcriptional regulator [Parvularculaceae bacterium]
MTGTMMGQAAKKGRRADPQKDEAIIDAASALFAARGYGVSIDEIAAAAGVSKQTIYARYAAKSDLLAAVVHRTAEDLVGPLSVSGLSLEDALTQFGDRFVDVVFAPAKIDMQRLIIAEAQAFPDLAESYYDNGPKFVRDRLALYLAKSCGAGRLAPLDAEEAAAQFVGLVIGSDHMSALMGLRPAPDERMRRARVRKAVAAFLKIYADV